MLFYVVYACMHSTVSDSPTDAIDQIRFSNLPLTRQILYIMSFINNDTYQFSASNIVITGTTLFLMI